jgi:protein-tyrosine phosphatase
VHIPIKNNFAPSFEQAMRWLAICKASQFVRRLLVHCSVGEGRTSTFCALVRIAQGMRLDDAITEQRTFGFQPNGEHKQQAVFLAEFYSSVMSGVVEIPRLDASRRMIT